MNERVLDVGEGLAILGVVAFALAYVFPLHDRLYSWPLPAVAAFAFLLLFAVVVAFRLILGPRVLHVEVVV